MGGGFNMNFPNFREWKQKKMWNQLKNYIGGTKSKLELVTLKNYLLE